MTTRRGGKTHLQDLAAVTQLLLALSYERVDQNHHTVRDNLELVFIT